MAAAASIFRIISPDYAIGLGVFLGVPNYSLLR